MINIFAVFILAYDKVTINNHQYEHIFSFFLDKHPVIEWLSHRRWTIYFVRNSQIVFQCFNYFILPPAVYELSRYFTYTFPTLGMISLFNILAIFNRFAVISNSGSICISLMIIWSHFHVFICHLCIYLLRWTFFLKSFGYFFNGIVFLLFWKVLYIQDIILCQI